MQFEITHRTGEELDYQFDFEKWLQIGETIVGSAWEAPEDSELVVGEDSTFTDDTATLWLSGGVASKARWQIINTITTSAGRIAQNILIVNIKE
jgi:hypothetical protein